MNRHPLLVSIALQQFPQSQSVWARVAIEVENGSAKRALSIPIVREATVPVDFGLPLEGGR